MVSQEIPQFMPGDVILCPGGRWLPHVLTRWATQARAERPTYAVHTAQFLSPDEVIEMDMVVKLSTTAEFFAMRKAFQVWRCNSLTLSQREALARKAREYQGRKFGWPKLLTHMLDGIANKMLRKPIYLFRRLNHDQRYPICSWITAFSYDKVLHYRFGVPPEGADPDQISDWINSHSGEWECVFRRAASTQPQANRVLPAEGRPARP